MDELSRPTVEVGIIGAVANDLSQAMPLELGGRPLKGSLPHRKTGQRHGRPAWPFPLKSSASREVGTEGKLGGQAKVKGVSGVWKN